MAYGRVAAHARRAGHWVARVAFPEVCAGCGVIGAWMCADCSAMCIPISAAACCPRCGSPERGANGACRRCVAWPPALVEARSVFVFDGPVRDAIHRLKYGHEHARAEWGAECLATRLVELGWDSDAIVAVPLHPRRQRERGYNHADKLARGLARRVGVSCAAPLERRRATRAQVGLGAAERLTNVANAFAATTSLAGQRVLLIDDVLTTGATLLDCARACQAAGAGETRALTLAAEG